MQWARQRIGRPAHHAAVRVGLRTGVLDHQRSLSISGVQATYAVTSWREWWRCSDGADERPVIKWVLGHVDADTVAWDVGAAVGTYSCLLARAGAAVVAVEPHQRNQARLRHNCGLNEVRDQVRIEPIALSDHDGRESLHVGQWREGSGNHQLNNGGVPVTVRRGETLTPAPDVLKIDVEGHERAVLDGLGGYLDSARAIVIEVHDADDVGDLRTRLVRAGFDTTTLRPDLRDEVYLAAEAGNTDKTETES